MWNYDFNVIEILDKLENEHVKDRRRPKKLKDDIPNLLF
jgi:hypothetical protein